MCERKTRESIPFFPSSAIRAIIQLHVSLCPCVYGSLVLSALEKPTDEQRKHAVSPFISRLPESQSTCRLTRLRALAAGAFCVSMWETPFGLPHPKVRQTRKSDCCQSLGQLWNPSTPSNCWCTIPTMLRLKVMIPPHPSLDCVGKQSLPWDIVRTPHRLPGGSLDKGEKYEQLEISS
jgi:hypothetical protein